MATFATLMERHIPVAVVVCIRDGAASYRWHQYRARLY
jgi:hypothetical protein